MNRASLRNEGKIHLGMVYANDSSMATSELQLEGALSFWPLLTRWAGGQISQLSVSTPFCYLVARDSLMSPSALEAHYDKLQNTYQKRLAERPELSYLGHTPEQLTRPMSADEIARHFDTGTISAAFQTAERSVVTEQLAALLQTAIVESPNIEFVPNYRVETICRQNGGFQVAGHGPSGSWALDADQVVNATWDGRLELDQQMGMEAEGWLYRLKYRTIAKLPGGPDGAPSATMVLGRYGDVVIRPDGTAYLSWYPSALRGWSQAIKPPIQWQAACQGQVSPEDSKDIAKDMIEAISQWYPQLSAAEPILVDAGVIVAYGDTDIDDKTSNLHQRSQVGVTSHEGYHSLDGGKLTTAPLFAELAARRVLNA